MAENKVNIQMGLHKTLVKLASLYQNYREEEKRRGKVLI
jgi:hypothetical protein